IGFDLVGPPLRMRLRRTRVFWAAVPEAAVDEDGYPRRPENEVGGTPEVGERLGVDSVSEAASSQLFPQERLGLRVALSPTAHPPHRGGVGGRRSGELLGRVNPTGRRVVLRSHLNTLNRSRQLARQHASEERWDRVSNLPVPRRDRSEELVSVWEGLE